MEEQILNEHKSVQKTIGRLTSKSLMNLVREVLLKLGKEDESAEDILFTVEGAKAKKDITDIIVKLLGCDDKPVAECNEEVCPECHKNPCECEDKKDLQEGLVDEALHGNFELETFFEMAKDIGLENFADLEKFLKNEAKPGESEWETMLRYRASLGNDFKIDPKKNESVEKGEKCILCGKEIKGHGNNPAPVKDSGKCCDDCNKKKVIPARIKALKEKKGLTEAISSQRIRVVLDLAAPTANRTFTTPQDVRKNFIVKYFKDKGELAGYLAELDGYEDYDDFKQELADSGDDLEDFEFKGDEQDVAIQYLLDAMSDPGDGTPNIQFISIDGKPAYEEYWVQYDTFHNADSLLSKGTRRQIVDYYLSNLEESFAPRRTPFSKVSESLDDEEDEIGYMVVFGNDPDNFDEVRDFSKVFDTEEEAVQFVKDELALSDYRFAIVDEEEPSGSGRTFTVNPQGEVEEVTGNHWKYSYTDYEDEDTDYEDDYYIVSELDDEGDPIEELKQFTEKDSAVEYADSLSIPACVQYIYYDEETEREEDDIIYYNKKAREMGLSESLDKKTHRNGKDRHCKCKKSKIKFNRDGFKFDDDFYGECVHKDCDEDDEIEMIFDDDPTISY